MINRSAPASLIVELCYEDVEEAIAWLCDAFGFEERFRYGNERVEGAQLGIGASVVMLFGPRRGHGAAEEFAFRAPRPLDASHKVSVRVADVDRHHRHAAERGARILLAPQTHPFGERQYSAFDLAGHLWTFTQSVADVAPSEWGAEPGSS